MSDSASLNFEGKEIKLPVIVGSENEKAIDISKLGDAQNLKDKEIIEFLGDD